MAKYAIAKVADFPPGTRRLVTLGGRPIVAFNIDGEYFALLNRCPHQGASLCHGAQVGFAHSKTPGEYELSRAGELIRCPWHGWEFDIKTGQSWFDPLHTKVRMFPSEVTTGIELVKGPYVAESFPVFQEEDYVVIEA